MHNNKKKGVIGIIIVIIILILLVLLTNTENSNISYIENVANKLVNPLQNGLTYVKNKLHKNDSFFTNINNLKTENEELKTKTSELETKLREFESIKAENETLKEYMNLTEKYSNYKTLAANVISRDISNYSKTIVINVGSKDGIKENMTVIASEGLVGYVISVTSNTSKVQTIVDSSSNTSSLLSSSRDSVVCKGQLEKSNILKAVYIPVEATVAKDDSIETSGLGGIYPKGIYIGKVSKVINTNNLTDRYAIVETAVNFNKLETVLVVITE
ncbi:MAG: rod shape-determining protein MreC [Clostridia bacterium]|nr:rod shape-determining protein MreC [Clostridia bacterium]